MYRVMRLENVGKKVTYLTQLQTKRYKVTNKSIAC